MTNERDPLELKVLGMLPNRTVDLPDGQRISTADSGWGELSSTWRPEQGSVDVFEDGWDNEPGGIQSGRLGLGPGRSMLVFAVRARVDSLEASAIMAGPQGGDWTIGLHYNALVRYERRLNFVIREEMLLGTPMWIRERLTFGLFVVGGPEAVNTDCGVTFSLVGLMIGARGFRDDFRARYDAFYAATHGPDRRPR